MRKPLEVMTARDVETLALGYVPAIDPMTLKNVVALAMGIAKMHNVMIVRADSEEYRLHLKYLTKIDWTT